MNGFFIRLLDLALSLSFIALGLPLFLGAVLLSSVAVGFPPLYSSRRLGRYGRPFLYIKIRSMKKGYSYGRDYLEQQRLNGAGRMLRRLHLDELGDLFYILAGTMSFVGPRPLNPEHLERFDTTLRHSVKPGWTCLAQIKLSRKGILYGAEQIRLDEIYVKRRSFVYNIKILAATLNSVFFRKGRRVTAAGANEYRKALIKKHSS